MKKEENGPFEVYLSVANYGTIREKSYKLAILPWGATEPHNYHLPYLTDVYIAHAVAVDAAQKVSDESGIPCMVLPPVAMGSQNPGQWNKPFCIHYRYETQRAILGDTVASLIRQGIHRLLIVNAHGGNNFKNMVRDLTFEYPDFLIVVADSFTIVPQEDFFENRDDHAGEMETSMMLYYYPELVHMELAGDGTEGNFSASSLQQKIGWLPRDWDRVSSDTGIGIPHKSSEEKGRKYAKAVVGNLALLIQELTSEKDLY